MQRLTRFAKLVLGTSHTQEGRRAGMYFWVGSWALLSVIGLLLPDDILRDHVWTRTFTDLVATVVPQIDRVGLLLSQLASKQDAIDTARFHYALLWTVSPLYFYVALRATYEDMKYKHKTVSFNWILLLIASFLLIVWFGVFQSLDPYDRLVQFIYGVPLIREIWASTIVIAILFLAAGLMSVLRGLRTGYVTIVN